jgi:hypothetical protein
MTELGRGAGPDAPGAGPSPLLRKELERQFAECQLVRPFHRAGYDPGDRLEYTVTGVAPAHTGRLTVEVERSVGGGFAGQVYRVRLLDTRADDGPIPGLVVGQHYAVKILKPSSGFARAFRDFLYFLAYQGQFSAQVNPAAVRVGVLWQKLIRRAAAARFGRDDAVCDTYATFYDEELHSFGEINEWIDGRIWKFEVDDRLFDRWSFRGKPPKDHNTPEYVNKKLFMRELVALLHEMGAPELARQYEWWSCKSQPNALKRLSAGDAPDEGLTAVDFRAGLALLPFLPMSPVDVRLILTGLVRGRLVQFDRSDPERFRQFVERHRDELDGLQSAVEELREQERVYRASLPDVTHHHIRLITDAGLRKSVRDGTITGWQNLGRLDNEHAGRLRNRPGLFGLLYLLSLIPLLGPRLLKLWGNAQTREHLKRCLTGFGYLRRSIRGSVIETLICWHRDERVSDERAMKLVHRPVRFWLHRILLGWTKPSWQRFLTDRTYAWSRTKEAVSFAYRFLRVPPFREAWLLGELELGRQEGMLTEAEAAKVASQMKDPYIQKYLRCLAVHICTLPITQIVMVVVGGAIAIYYSVYHGVSWAQSTKWGVAAAAVIQLAPISPGSISRGLFVFYLMIRERDIRSYYIAAPVSFIHVVGYLAFPFQMVGHDPALARFLAGRWAKSLVHVVPVFGEKGGLLEHAVFDFFFNLPLSVKQRFKVRPIRYAAATLCVTAALAFFGFLGVVRVWEWRQPKVQLQAVKVTSIAPSDHWHGYIGWKSRGVTVRFEGRDVAVDYPAKRWDESVKAGESVNAVIRKCFFRQHYDGLQVAKSSLRVTSSSTCR